MSLQMPSEPPSPSLLADPVLRRHIEEFVRRRVPASDVDDIVQTVPCDALAATDPPKERNDVKRWVVGIARHKVADFHRRTHREPPTELPELETEPPPVEELELARWAEEQAGSSRDARETLRWMAREG